MVIKSAPASAPEVSIPPLLLENAEFAGIELNEEETLALAGLVTGVACERGSRDEELRFRIMLSDFRKYDDPECADAQRERDLYKLFQLTSVAVRGSVQLSVY